MTGRRERKWIPFNEIPENTHYIKILIFIKQYE